MIEKKEITSIRKSQNKLKKPISLEKKNQKIKKISNNKKSNVIKLQDNALLPKSLFFTKINTQAIFDVIMSERAAKRQGTHKTKNKAEVSGTGKKPWSQKGTGKARASSLRSNIFVGGGVVFGPNVKRNYNLKVNKKVRKLALTSALTLKAKNNKIIINKFNLSKPSTKSIITKLEELKIKNKKVLIVTEDINIFKSISNLQKVKSQKLSSISIESIINADVLILNKDHLISLERMFK